MSISKRLEELINTEGTRAKFSRKTGVKSAALGNLISKGDKGNIRSDTILLIGKAYPNLNLRWLIMGEGNMWLDDASLSSSEQEDQEIKHMEIKIKHLKEQVTILLQNKELTEEQNKKLKALLEEYRGKKGE